MPRDNETLSLLAPAKVNFSLEILGKRPDGYHELKMLMAPISLYDEIDISPLPVNSLEVFSEGSEYVCSGEENICHRAASFYFEETGISGGAKIEVRKNIPVGAGLGGGSSDAAATIMALERLYGRKLSEDSRKKAAFKVGADLPFFFAKGWALVEGIGEKVTPITPDDTLWLVVAHPGVFLSTAAVFSHRTNVLTTTSLVPTIMQFNFRGVSEGVRNDLQEAALAIEPAIGELFSAFENSGSKVTFLTGSGSAVVSLSPSRKEAERVAQNLSAVAKTGWRIEVAHTLGEVSLFFGVK